MVIPQVSHSKEKQGKLILVDSSVCPNLYMWTDVCNVYILWEGDAALLIELGNDSVLEYLKQSCVKKIEWVFFTHHHREQCQGYPLYRNKR
jgi:beta-lactamase superfamily II metal-dependent hydrolase